MPALDDTSKHAGDEFPWLGFDRVERDRGDRELRREKERVFLGMSFIWGHSGNFTKTWLLIIKISFVVTNKISMFYVVIFSNFHHIYMHVILRQIKVSSNYIVIIN